MEDSCRTILKEGIKIIDPHCNHEKLLEDLSVFYDQIDRFNPVFKLVGAQKEEIVKRHILDSLAPVNIIENLIPDNANIADLGSGSGLPGLVLSCALENRTFNLVDRMGRRIGFLRNTVAVMKKTNNVNIVEKDLSSLEDTFNAVIFRAFRPLEDIISHIDRITRKGSVVIAYKSSEDNISQEKTCALSYGGFDVSDIDYVLPFSDAKRSLLILKKLR